MIDPAPFAALWRPAVPPVEAATAPLAALGRDLADHAAVVAGWTVSVIVHAHVVEQLTPASPPLRRRAARCRARRRRAQRANDLDFLDSVLRQEVDGCAKGMLGSVGTDNESPVNRNPIVVPVVIGRKSETCIGVSHSFATV